MFIIFHSSLLLILAVALSWRAFKLVRRKAYVRLFGELFVPVFLWTVYGLMGFGLFFEDDPIRFSYAGVNFTNVDIFLAFLAMTGAIITVPLGFRLAFRDRSHGEIEVTLRQSRDRAAKIFVTAALIFDLVARVKMVIEGSYFSWLRADLITAGVLVPGGAMAQIQSALEPLIGALLIFLVLRSKRWLPILAIFLFLVLLKGERSAIYEVGIAAGLSYLAFSGKGLGWRRTLAYAGGSLVFVVVVSALIADLRIQYRTGRSQAMEHPGAFVVNLVGVALPEAIRHATAAPRVGNGVGLYSRLSMWQGSLASEINRGRLGSGRMPWQEFTKALALPIPSLLYPGSKPRIEQGPAASQWYATGWHKPNSKLDPATTVFSDIYRFAGALGVILLGLVFGLTNGAFARFAVSRYESIGIALFFGSVGVMSIRANSYGAVLVGVRNLAIVVLLLELAWILSRLRWTGRSGDLSVNGA